MNEADKKAFTAWYLDFGLGDSRNQESAWQAALAYRDAQSAQGQQDVDNSKVICPSCCNQFRAIPVDVQKLMIDAGFEPPFTTKPAAQGKQEPVAIRRRTYAYPHRKDPYLVVDWKYCNYSEREYQKQLEEARLFTGDRAVRIETTIELVYTTPPAAQPVRLTDGEIERNWQFLHDEEGNPPCQHTFAHAIMDAMQAKDAGPLVEALRRIADKRNKHFAGDAQVVAAEALAKWEGK